MTGRAAATLSATANSTIPNRFITFPPGEKGGFRGFAGTSEPAPLLEKGFEKSSVGWPGAPCHNAHNIRCHLQKAPLNLQAGGHLSGPRLADSDNSLPQEGHKWGVAWEDPYKPVVRRRNDRFRLPVEHRPLRRNDRDAHQAEAIFLACAITSSMAPCM